MDRVNAPGATPDRMFREGNPFAGVAGTVVPALWLDGVQEEPLAVIEAAGLTPAATQKNQLLQALQILYGLSATAPSVVAAGPARAGVQLPQIGSRNVVTLLRQAGIWTAGETPDPPVQTPSNTLLPNEYSTGVYAGDAWPFMSVGAQQISTGGGNYPADIFGSAVNYYRHGGFFLEGGLFAGGAVIEIHLAGEVMTDAANRIIEFIVEPDFDPDAAFDATKSIPFQTSAIADLSGAAQYFEAIIRLESMGYDKSAGEWIVGARLSYRQGNSATGNTNAVNRALLQRFPVAKVDFAKDQIVNIRFKTDDLGSTLGDMGNSSGSDQAGTEITATVRSAQVQLYPGGI